MKPKHFILLSSALVFLLGGCKKEETALVTINFSTRTLKPIVNCDFSTKESNFDGLNTFPECYEEIGNVKIDVYDSKEKWKAGQGSIATIYSDAKGNVSYSNRSFLNLYFRASKDSLNSFGLGDAVNGFKTYFQGEKISENLSKGYIVLGLTRTKLSLQVFKGGVAQAGKQVKIFFSEADRSANRVYLVKDVEFTYVIEKGGLGYLNPIRLDQFTNAEGMVNFVGDLMMPKKYYFLVDGQIPVPGNTDGALKDDPNITTSLQVSIP